MKNQQAPFTFWTPPSRVTLVITTTGLGQDWPMWVA
jgi:hypothetical protein